MRTYTWGLDLAGLNGSIGSVTGGADLESAGGIGGLLAMHDPDSDGPGNPGDADRDFAVLYDANGDVGQLVG